ncbi:SHOCT domain-containing protein [Sulfurospirillum sp. 1612]|uniref:SHOCT domain-containing protein n=1 Tax=Sulfurospirillum sp. 1612 TaxID=3094835 RepID=UPI002F947853
MKNKFLVGIFLVGSMATDIFAHGGETDSGYGMMGYNMMGGFGMGFSWLILILIGIFAYYMVSKNNNQNENNGDKPTARDILDQRFANGEIDKEEYQEKKEMLK